jgi:hypothetical protein
MFAFLSAPVRLAVRAITRDAAAEGFAEGIGDVRQAVAAALAETPADDAPVLARIQAALAGPAGALADKPKRRRKAAA